MFRAPVFLGILLSLLPFGIYSQCYSAHSYTASDGMVSSSVYDIVQDSKGVLWFATAGGVAVHDGCDWINYTRANGFPFQQCNFLLIGNRDVIWAFSDEISGGAARFQPGQSSWIHIKNSLPPSKDLEIISGAALLENDPSRPPVIGITTNTRGFYLLSGQKWTSVPFPAQSGRDGAKLYDIVSWKRSFYLASSQGIYSVNPDNPAQWNLLPGDFPSPETYCLTPGFKKDGPPERLWAAGNGWAGYWSQGRFTLVFKKKFPRIFYSIFTHKENLAFWADPFEGVWLGHDKLIMHISKSGKYRVFNILSNVVSDGAYTFFLDEEFNLWLGNFRGAHRVSHLQFEQYTKRDGLFQDEVTAIEGFDNGALVFGHNGGLSFLSQGNIKTVPFSQVKRKFQFNSRVLSLCKDTRGNIWAAVEKKGVVKISPDLSMKWFAIPEPAASQTYNTLAVSGGALWLGAGRFLYKWNHDANSFRKVAGFASQIYHIRNIYFDSNNTLWACSGGKGIYKLKIKSGKISGVTRIMSSTGRNANSVYAVYQAPGQRILAGTKAGLFEVRENRLEPIKSNNMRIDIPVYFIVPEPGRGIWFGTANGVINWENGQMRRYTTKNGLVGREANRSAAWFDKEGHLWMGFDLGASRYIRQREILQRPPPRLELLRLNASGQHFSLDRENHLKPSLNDLTFYFRGISYIDEKELIYSYKLEGFDSHWTVRTRQFGNQVRYTNVPPGQYRFFIKVARPGGQSSPQLSSKAIIIAKPFHRTFFFYFITGAGGILLILFMVTYLNKRRHTRRLELEVRQRTRQLEESEQEIRYLFDNVHDALLIIDPEGEIVLELNNRACEQYGFSRREFTGKSMKDISENLQRGEKMVKDTFANGTIHGVDTVQFRKDGSKMFLEVNATLVNFRGKKAILSINRDITERKTNELQTAQSLKEKTVLLQEVHHRVKNNLQIISSLMDLQADRMEDPKTAKLLLENKSRVHSLALLYDNLFQSDNLAQIDIDDYVEDIVAYLFSFANTTGISYSLDIESVSLEMDKAIPLGLILTELVFNALKHAFPGGGEGEITITLHRLDHTNLMLKIWDNGVGLAGKPLFQHSQSLGLQLVSSLSGQLNGRLEIDETEGTSFILTFPYQNSRNSQNSGNSNAKENQGVSP